MASYYTSWGHGQPSWLYRIVRAALTRLYVARPLRDSQPLWHQGNRASSFASQASLTGLAFLCSTGEVLREKKFQLLDERLTGSTGVAIAPVSSSSAPRFSFARMSLIAASTITSLAAEGLKKTESV